MVLKKKKLEPIMFENITDRCPESNNSESVKLIIFHSQVSKKK